MIFASAQVLCLNFVRVTWVRPSTWSEATTMALRLLLEPVSLSLSSSPAELFWLQLVLAKVYVALVHLPGA